MTAESDYNPEIVDWFSVKTACARVIAHEARFGNFWVRTIFHDQGAFDFQNDIGGADASSLLNKCEALRPENNYDNFHTHAMRPLYLLSYYYQSSVADTLRVCGATALELR